jgi:GAF domain-containing protein
MEATKQTIDQNLSREELYPSLLEQVRAVLEGETNLIANLGNAAALLFHALPEVNWAGFYLYENGELVLGPFQGKIACTRIPLGKGVCGTAAQQHQTVRVADVHQFPGHIACDIASASEIVIPLLKDGHLLGVLDIDSPRPYRFDETDQMFLEAYAREVLASLK